MQVKAPLTEKIRGRGWVVLIVETKMTDISPVPRVRTRRKNSLKKWQEQQEDNSNGDICYLENICGAEQP